MPVRSNWSWLTAVRLGEARGARWADFDLDGKVCIIPAERMKAGREHCVPLTQPVLRLLKALPKGELTELVFEGREQKLPSDMGLSAVMRRMGIEAVPHGLRSTFRDWLGD